MASMVEDVNEILYDAAEGSGLDELILIGEEGLVIGSHGKDNFVDLLNLVSIKLHKPIIELACDSSGVHFDEVVTTTADKMRFCFRFFKVDGDDYVLAAVFPKKRAYRRATNIAIRRLKKLLG